MHIWNTYGEDEPCGCSFSCLQIAGYNSVTIEHIQQILVSFD